MCEVLGIARSTYLRVQKEPRDDSLTEEIIEIFKVSRNNYGTRKIKVELEKKGVTVSRQRIVKIMKEEELISTYTVAQFKPFKSKVNEEPVTNILNRAFDNQSELAVGVSDLTYVCVNGKWNYVCLFVEDNRLFLSKVMMYDPSGSPSVGII